LNAASYGGTLAPGAWAAIFGTQLAPATLTAQAVPLPYTLGGVSVTVGGLPAPLGFVSANQINIIVPFEASAGAGVPVVVTTPGGTGAPLNVALTRDAPALFTQNAQGTGMALAFDASFHALTAVGSGAIVLYAAGLGPTDPAPASSALGGSATEPYNAVEDNLAVLIGETPCVVAFAGLAPGFPGVYQLNVIPPPNPLSNRLYLSQNGVLSNVVTLPIPVGTNVTNLSGAIDGLYPASGLYATRAGGRSMGGPLAFSAMPTAAAVTVSFDILPAAKPFAVAATSPAGNAVFRIDPVQGTWQGYATSPFGAPRVYDFSGTGLQVYNLQTGLPFPGDAVPASLLDPVALTALAMIPPPNSGFDPTAPSPNGTLTYSVQPLDASGHFSIGSGSGQPLDLSNGLFFGGFIDLGAAPAPSQTAQFLLFVDGVLVASKDIPYTAY
jgi:uncharacterized protein (TIGR03437 family)